MTAQTELARLIVIDGIKYLHSDFSDELVIQRRKRRHKKSSFSQRKRKYVQTEISDYLHALINGIREVHTSDTDINWEIMLADFEQLNNYSKEDQQVELIRMLMKYVVDVPKHIHNNFNVRRGRHTERISKKGKRYWRMDTGDADLIVDNSGVPKCHVELSNLDSSSYKQSRQLLKAFNEFQRHNPSAHIKRFIIQFGGCLSDYDLSYWWSTYNVVAIRLPRIQDMTRQDVRRLIKFLAMIVSCANKEEPNIEATCLLERLKRVKREGKGLSEGESDVELVSSSDFCFDLLLSLGVIRSSSSLSMTLCTTDRKSVV